MKAAWFYLNCASFVNGLVKELNNLSSWLLDKAYKSAGVVQKPNLGRKL
jgi:hypothetical protein